MGDPKWWAVGVSIVALVVSSGSLIYARRTYERAGARVVLCRADSRDRLPRRVAVLLYSTDAFTFEILNQGLAPAEVRGYWEVKPRRFWDARRAQNRGSDVTERHHGALTEKEEPFPFPHTLPGKHSFRWTTKPSLPQRLQFAGTDYRARPVVSVGDGTAQRGPWFTVRDLDDAQLERELIAKRKPTDGAS